MAYPTILAGQKVTASLLTSMEMVTVVKAANQAVTSSTTLVNDNELFLSVAASAVYQLDGWIPYDGAFSAGDFKTDWSVPTGATMLWSPNGPSTGGSALYTSNTVAAGTTVSIGTYGTGGAYTSASVRGRLVTSTTAGTLQFKWAQNSSNATATTVYAGAWIRLLRVS